MARGNKRPTHTGTVFDYLVGLDDFASVSRIAAETRLPPKSVRTALLMLREYKAVDSTDVQGVLWWCATPVSDTRIRRMKQITEHTRRAKSVASKELKS